MASKADYPYTDGWTGDTTKDCTLKGKPVAIETGSGYKVTWYGEVGDTKYAEKVERLKYALSLGPVAISMKADCTRIMMYKRGVLTSDADCRCGPDDDYCLNHAVLAVGYNDLANPPYWLIMHPLC